MLLLLLIIAGNITGTEMSDIYPGRVLKPDWSNQLSTLIFVFFITRAVAVAVWPGSGAYILYVVCGFSLTARLAKSP